ncbi:MAG: hypothetical protein H6Q78_1001 [Candidatus Krumholzibacteriota bacterium]|nr:hypothetical protein [Candidatus Krumholzibacteriota bacterium]
MKRVLGYLFAAACLVWVFHDIDLQEFASHMKTIAWWVVGVGIACDILSYVCQGFRWKMLLRPTGELPVIRTTQAIYVGLFTNEIVPLRVGELAHAIWLAIAVGLAALFVPLPHRLIVGEEALGAIILVLTAVFVFAVVRKGKSIGSSAPARRGRGSGFMQRLVAEMAGGLAKIGLSRGFFLAALGSAGILVFQMLAFWLIMAAMRMPLSVWQGAVCLLVVHMGTAIPNAPSNVGSYQFFTVVALAIFGVDKTAAASFSVVAFVLLTIPLWLIGLAALRKTGMSFAELRAEAAKLVGLGRS